MDRVGEQLTRIQGKAGAIDPTMFSSPAKGVVHLDGALKASFGEQIPARVRMRRGRPELRLRVPRNAPPGVHQASFEVDNRRYPITIEVPVKQRLRVTPPELHFSGAPGEQVSATFVVENRGNQEVELPKHAIAGAFASDGLATAFSSSYELDTDDANELFKNFILRLRDSYGGLMKLRIENADTPLKTGEQRQLKATLTLPSQENARGNLKLGKGRRFQTIFRYGDIRLVGRIIINP